MKQLPILKANKWRIYCFWATIHLPLLITSDKIYPSSTNPEFSRLAKTWNHDLENAVISILRHNNFMSTSFPLGRKTPMAAPWLTHARLCLSHKTTYKYNHDEPKSAYQDVLDQRLQSGLLLWTICVNLKKISAKIRHGASHPNSTR
jgi:hypothetical protein